MALLCKSVQELTNILRPREGRRGLFDQDVDLAVKKETEENFVLNTPPQLTSRPLTTDSDCTSVLGSCHGHPDTYGTSPIAAPDNYCISIFAK